MKLLLRLFALVHFIIALLLLVAALIVIGIALNISWNAFGNGLGADAAQSIIEAIGLIAVAIVAVQIAQTVIEEEVIREAHVSAPTRVRRFLSRFMVVLVVAIAIEGLVASGRGTSASRVPDEITPSTVTSLNTSPAPGTTKSTGTGWPSELS